MSKRSDVLEAIKVLVRHALPNCDVQGLTDDAERPKRISPLGLVIVRDGDPGDPAIDLGGPAYNYDHAIPIELAAFPDGRSLRQVLDQMAGAIGAAVEADRFLGGRCHFLDVTALDLVDLSLTGAATQLGGQFAIVASYSTSNPLA